VAQTEPGGEVVCDAGPLIHLDELGCVDLLSDFAHVFVPGAVWREVQRHRPAALRRRTVSLERVSVSPIGDPEILPLVKIFLLDAGESEALQLMSQAPSAVLLTDDAAARLVAKRLGREVHGSIGILVRALRRHQRTKKQVLNLLRSIPRRSSLFIDARLLQSVIEQVENA
jgi:predicted nucleic acid-binding protein